MRQKDHYSSNALQVWSQDKSKAATLRLTLLLKHSQRIPKQRHDITIRIICVDGLPHDTYLGSLHKRSILSSQMPIAYGS